MFTFKEVILIAGWLRYEVLAMLGIRRKIEI
jgi:hypothetical protein